MSLLSEFSLTRSVIRTNLFNWVRILTRTRTFFSKAIRIHTKFRTYIGKSSVPVPVPATQYLGLSTFPYPSTFPYISLTFYVPRTYQVKLPPGFLSRLNSRNLTRFSKIHLKILKNQQFDFKKSSAALILRGRRV